MSEFKVFLDGVETTVAPGANAIDLYKDNKDIVVAKINGQVVDLATALKANDKIEGISASSEEGLAVIRHSTAHIAAQAVQKLRPQTKLGIGPPIKDGFYYDFKVEEFFTPEDLTQIEKTMKEIIKSGQRFSRRVSDEASLRKELANEPFK